MKIIVITGASGGVGKSTVELFLKKDFTVVGLSSNQSKLEKLAKNIDNHNFHYYSMDIKNFDSVSETFDRIAKHIGKIDILVNNAAIFINKKFDQCSVNNIDNIIDTNVKGTMYCTMEALHNMKMGRIINIGSVSGIHGIAGQAIYSASKFALNGFMDSLGQEFTKNEIHITTICPGGIDTPLWNKSNPYNGNTYDLLKSETVAEAIYYAATLPNNVTLKTMTIFPTCEWH